MAVMPQLSARFRVASRVCGIVVSVVGALVLAAWALHDPRLERALAGHFIMQLNTGVLFIVAGAALWIRRPRTLAVACASIVVVGGAFMIARHIRAGAILPSRMEPDTACGFLLIGAALVLRHFQSRAATRSEQALTIACL